MGDESEESAKYKAAFEKARRALEFIHQEISTLRPYLNDYIAAAIRDCDKIVKGPEG